MTLPKVDPTMTLCPYIPGEKTSKAPDKAINGPPGTSSSRAMNSKIPYTLTLSLPFPVVKPCHWSRPFTPHFRPSDRGKFLVETVIFAW
jgi:hypothetical protein